MIAIHFYLRDIAEPLYVLMWTRRGVDPIGRCRELWSYPAEPMRIQTVVVGGKRMHDVHRTCAHVGVGSPEPNPVTGYMRGWWSPRAVPPSSNSKDGTPPSRFRLMTSGAEQRTAKELVSSHDPQ